MATQKKKTYRKKCVYFIDTYSTYIFYTKYTRRAFAAISHIRTCGKREKNKKNAVHTSENWIPPSSCVCEWVHICRCMCGYRRCRSMQTPIAQNAHATAYICREWLIRAIFAKETTSQGQKKIK